MQQKYLVTGAGGFIGTHLVTALRSQGNHVETRSMDLSGPLPTNVDGVFHLAAVVDSRGDTLGADPYAAIRGNTRLIEQVRSIYARTNTTIVFASTEVYYGQPTTLPTPETAPVGWSDATAPRWAYSIGKFAAEQLLRHGTTHGRIARLGNVYGPGARHGVVHDLIDLALTGEAWTVANPADTRTFCYIDDVVDGLIRLMGPSVAMER